MCTKPTHGLQRQNHDHRGSQAAPICGHGQGFALAQLCLTISTTKYDARSQVLQGIMYASHFAETLSKALGLPWVISGANVETVYAPHI